MIHDKKVLLIGGSGSLGNAFIKKHLENNEIYVYSRDECKHWTMQLQYNNHPNLKFIIGNICNKEKIQQTVLRHNFHIIINAAAMKHIDKCEYESNECLNTNIIGPQNLVNLKHLCTLHLKIRLILLLLFQAEEKHKTDRFLNYNI